MYTDVNHLTLLKKKNAKNEHQQDKRKSRTNTISQHTKYSNNNKTNSFSIFYEPKCKWGKIHFFGVGFCFLIILLQKP